MFIRLEPNQHANPAYSIAIAYTLSAANTIHYNTILHQKNP